MGDWRLAEPMEPQHVLPLAAATDVTAAAAAAAVAAVARGAGNFGRCEKQGAKEGDDEALRGPHRLLLPFPWDGRARLPNIVAARCLPPQSLLSKRTSNIGFYVHTFSLSLSLSLTHTHIKSNSEMPPVATFDIIAADAAVAPDNNLSKTHQYRKVMKPLLERKRRARINKCLDELKDLMVFALQSEGESITKLEKADVLELTVRHLQKLKRQQMIRSNPALDMDRYRSGFSACASEVSRCLASIPGININIGTALMSHLGSSISALERTSAITSPLTVNTVSPAAAPPATPSPPTKQPLSPHSDSGYTSGRETSSPTSIHKQMPSSPKSGDSVWRPF